MITCRILIEYKWVFLGRDGKDLCPAEKITPKIMVLLVCGTLHNCVSNLAVLVQHSSSLLFFFFFFTIIASVFMYLLLNQVFDLACLLISELNKS